MIPSQSRWANPNAQAYFDSFSSPYANPHVFYANESRMWRLLTLVSSWCVQLLIKVMRCFQFVQNYRNVEEQACIESIKMEIIAPLSPIQPPIQTPTQPPIQIPIQTPKQIHIQTEDDKLKELKEIFSQPIDYPYFFNRILSCKNRDKKLLFNNYNLDIYLQLKSHNFDMLNQYDSQEDKEFAASKAVYEIIVDLYVKRFFQKYPQLNQEDYLPSLRTIALGIAIKCSWDEDVWNNDFAGFIIPYMGIDRHNVMEIEFLKGINWDTSLTELLSDGEDEIFVDEAEPSSGKL